MWPILRWAILRFTLVTFAVITYPIITSASETTTMEAFLLHPCSIFCWLALLQKHWQPGSIWEGEVLQADCSFWEVDLHWCWDKCTLKRSWSGTFGKRWWWRWCWWWSVMTQLLRSWLRWTKCTLERCKPCCDNAMMMMTMMTGRWWLWWWWWQWWLWYDGCDDDDTIPRWDGEWQTLGSSYSSLQLLPEMCLLAVRGWDSFITSSFIIG